MSLDSATAHNCKVCNWKRRKESVKEVKNMTFFMSKITTLQNTGDRASLCSIASVVRLCITTIIHMDILYVQFIVSYVAYTVLYAA